MAEFLIQGETLEAIGEAIRGKTGGSDPIMPKDMASQINAIESGGGGGEDDFIGIKYSNYSGAQYNLPKTADARSLDKVLTDNGYVENGNALYLAFANANANSNGGYFAQLEEVYLPSKVIALTNTFSCCSKLQTIHGDLSNITGLNVAFAHCKSLDINAVLKRMTKLQTIGNQSFLGCTQATEITLPVTITSIHSGAFSGCTNVTNVYCPWAKGAVTNAPWGMTNATIWYGVAYIENGIPYDKDGKPIEQEG